MISRNKKTTSLKLALASLFVLTPSMFGLAWTCFEVALPVKYQPLPFCYLGTETPFIPNNGWQCNKYYIHDAGFGWVCTSDDDGAVECGMVQTTVTVTEWGGFCDENKHCQCHDEDVLYFQELWSRNVAREHSPCNGGLGL